MARESCNLDKEEAEILKPSSPSSSSPSPPPPPAASAASLFLKPSQDLPVHGEDRAKVPPAADPGASAAPCDQEKSPEGEEEGEQEPQTPVRFTNRCSSCQRKVGLTGFRCRCGDLFCSRHRYSDAHDCSFDYKAAGREEISKANPVVRAAKIIKI